MGQARSNWKKDGTIPKLAGVMIISLSSLLFSGLCGYMRMKRDAHKGGKVFKRQLRQQGLNEEQAAELTELYLQPSRIANYF